MATQIKFNAQQGQTEFVNALRQRVNAYFKDNNISQTGDYRMVVKTIILLALYLGPFVVILLNLVPGWAMLLLCVIMGIGIAGVGMSVMHDANHGAYSSNAKVNAWMSRTMYLLGGSKFTWRIQHNLLHHTYTNIYGLDEDIDDKPILRLSPHGKYNFMHRFQHLYWFLLYGLATFTWTLHKDFRQLIRYNREGWTKAGGGSPVAEMVKLIISKVVYYLVALGLPMFLLPYSFGYIFLGFFIMHFTAGFILTTIFQLAHVVEDTSTFDAEAQHGGSVENAWAIHQLYTTANFAHRNRLLSWFVGGLNYQIEHHLFQHICHINYRKISPIVKQVAKEYNIPYFEYRTFWGALRSHLRTLRRFAKLEGREQKAAA